MMDDSEISLKLNPIPIRNIIKSNLVQHANKTLCHITIDELSEKITETIECFLNKQLKEFDLTS